MTTEKKTSASTEKPGSSPMATKTTMHGSNSFGLGFRVLLVGAICLNLLYLTRDLGLRVDLTQEKLFSLSASTTRILDRIEKPLVIEAYFSKDLPSHLQPDRNKMEDLLDEYVQISKNRLKVVYLDPTTDKALEDRARRLGMQAQPVQVMKASSVSMQLVWQGMRIRYGGDRQKILPMISRALGLEEILTPAIHELILQRRPKVGFIAKPNTPPRNPYQQQAPPPSPGWQVVQKMITGRYDVVPIDVSKGQQFPEDLEVLVLIEPKNLTDWEKYCIDQHVMRGGNLLLFADVADYGFDPYNPFARVNFDVDQPDSKLSFKQQLLTYGVDWGQHVVAEMLAPELQGQAHSFVFGPDGRPNNIERKFMPYWLKVLRKDWATWVPHLTKDPAAAAKLAEELTWGMNPANPVFGQNQYLSLFWPTDVSLTQTLPEGVTGEVLLRTSPKGVAQLPPQNSSPQASNVGNSLQLRQLANSEAHQISLGVQVKGLFPSAFAGKERPKRPGQENQDQNGGLVAQDPAETKEEPASKNASQEPTSDKNADKKTDKQAEKKADKNAEKNVDNNADKNADKQADQDPDFMGAPTPEGQKDKVEDKLPPKLDKAEKAGRILVIGDANIIRDDHLTARFPQWMSQNMPGMVSSLYSAQGGSIFNNLMDWMALDLDLVELRSRRNVDRKLDFIGEVSPDEDQELIKARVATKKIWIQWSNILIPVLLLLGFGLVITMKRAAEKRAFLSSAEATG